MTDVRVRPAVSNCVTPTEKISEFGDFHLQPIIKTLPFIIKDTTDFLCTLKELGDIPHGEGLNCMKEIIEEFVRKSESNKICIGADDLVDLAKFILENFFLNLRTTSIDRNWIRL